MEEQPKYKTQKPNTEPTNAVPVGVSTEPEVTGSEEVELVEELADTATITELVDTFILDVSEEFNNLIGISYQGNPVLTHLQLVEASKGIIRGLYDLRRQLIDSVAKRGEEVTEKGGLLRTQVIDAEEN